MIQSGNSQTGIGFSLTPEQEAQVRLLIPELESSRDEDWQYLVTRPHPWRRQLYIKGRKLLASTVWQDMMTNEMSAEEAADNWDLPLSAIYEVIRYLEGGLGEKKAHTVI